MLSVNLPADIKEVLSRLKNHPRATPLNQEMAVLLCREAQQVLTARAEVAGLTARIDALERTMARQEYQHEVLMTEYRHRWTKERHTVDRLRARFG